MVFTYSYESEWLELLSECRKMAFWQHPISNFLGGPITNPPSLVGANHSCEILYPLLHILSHIALKDRKTILMLTQTSNRDCIRWITNVVYNQTSVICSIWWDTWADRQLYGAFINLSDVSSCVILHCIITWYDCAIFEPLNFRCHWWRVIVTCQLYFISYNSNLLWSIFDCHLWYN